MSFEVGFPAFAEDVVRRFPLQRVAWECLHDVANVFPNVSETGPKMALYYSAASVVNIFSGTVLLALNGFGSEAMTMCRSLFETAMTTVYLGLHPELASDYVDYGDMVKHRIAKRFTSAVSDEMAQETKQAYESIKNKFKAERLGWHQLSNKDLADATGFSDIYNDWYILWSSLSHGDFISVGTRMATQNRFGTPPSIEYVEYALNHGIEITARMVHKIGHLAAVPECVSVAECVFRLLDQLEPQYSVSRRQVLSKSANQKLE